MQTIIINSFYNEHNATKGRYSVNEDEWNVKLRYVHAHFGLFCQYAQNQWKQKTDKGCQQPRPKISKTN